MSENQTEKFLLDSMEKIMGPVAKMLLKKGVSHKSFSDLAKRAFVKVASEEFEIPGKKQSISRVSMLTGLTRKDVQAITQDSKKVPAELGLNRASRVVFGWLRDPEFINGKSKPLTLEMEGNENSFSELCKRYSGDVPYQTIIKELLRLGVITQTKDNKVSLSSIAYMPAKSEEEILKMMGTDVSDFLGVFENNLSPDAPRKNLQRKVSYTNIPDECLDEIDELAKENAQSFLEKMNSILSKYDRDVNPDIDGEGENTVSLGVYCRARKNEQEKE